MAARSYPPLIDRLAVAFVFDSAPLDAATVEIDRQLAGNAISALIAASDAYRACMSAWACGEPPHRVKDMVAAVERLGFALGEPGAPPLQSTTLEGATHG